MTKSSQHDNGFAGFLKDRLKNSRVLTEIFEKNKPNISTLMRVASGREFQYINRLKGEVKSLRSEIEQLKAAIKQVPVDGDKPYEPLNRDFKTIPKQPWERFYDAEVLRHYAPPTGTIVDNFRETVDKFPGKDFTLFQGATIDYRTADRYTDAIAAALQERGVRKGDRVAIQLPNIPQVVLAYYGVMKAGGIVVFVSPLYTEEEIQHQINDAKPVVYITLDIIYDKRIRKIRSKLPSVRNVLLADIKSFLPAHLRQLYPIKAKKTGMLAEIRKDDPVESLDQLIDQTNPEDYKPVTVTFEDIAVLQYTGGTTGRSKGAILTHSNLANNISQLQALQYSCQPGEESILTAVPIFHVLGMTVCMNFGVKIGACLIMIPKFDIDLIVKAITRYQPTFFPGVPTMFVAFNNYPGITELDVSSIKSCFSGSAPLPEEVMRRFEQLTGSKIVEGYGLSETSPVTHVNPLYGKRKLNSIGIPIPGTEAKVCDMETGKECPPNTPGELLIRGPQVMRGYWNMTEETDRVLKDGWLRTGDVAQIDDDGYFAIVDRIKDMIIAGGFNIYPREIDEVLFTHPSIAEAVSVGIPDAYRGETVKAFIVLKEGKSLSDEDVKNFCRQHLAAFKVPTQVEFRPELPKNMVGKILRKVLRDEEIAKANMKKAS